MGWKTLTLLFVIAAAITAGDAAGGPGDGIVRGRATLVPPGGPLPPAPTARMAVEIRPADAAHAAVSRFVVDVDATPVTPYTLLADDPATEDPALVPFADFVTGPDGRAKVEHDTRDGDPMPFGAPLDALGGRAIELREGGATVLVGTIPAAVGPSKPVQMRGKSDLTRSLGSALPDSAGRVRADFRAADGAHAAWSRLAIDVRGLAPAATYTLWADDPATGDHAMTQFGALATKADGAARTAVDTRKGAPLPFGASLATLGGAALEVRDDAGAAVLTGAFPIPVGPPGAPHGPPLHGRGKMAPPGGPLPPPPTGRIDEELRAATATTAAGSRLRISVDHLAADAAFTLWADDPATPGTALETFGALTTDAKGRGALELDSSQGDPMPFGAALLDLGGVAVEVRDAAAAVVLVGAFAPLTSPPPAPKPALRGRSDLTRSVGSAFAASVGRVAVEFRPATEAAPAASRLAIEVRGLAPVAAYTLLADDPATSSAALVAFGTITTDARGAGRLDLETKRGDTLPFDASLETLGARALEVRDAADTVLLRGAFPTPQ